MFNQLTPFLKRPGLYEESTSPFWDDSHISKGMLEAHLNPNEDGATRKAAFVAQSAGWITDAFPPKEFPELMDLGCGPGLYAEQFCNNSYRVTGVDFSARSIRYALESAASKNLNIRYIFQDYLKLSYTQQFDIITMIYCDFGVLSDENRAALLKIIYNALKPNGVFIFDVFTPNFYKDRKESKTWTYSETSFFSPTPSVNLASFYRYDNSNTFLEQYIIMTDSDIQCYNLWNHGFTASELKQDLSAAGFSNIQLFGDVAGTQYSETGNTICVVAGKEG